MSSYRTIDQGLPPYSGAQQPAGSFGQLNLLQRNSRENAAPRPPHDVRHGDGNESEDWDKDVLGPGEIEAEALNVCQLFFVFMVVLVLVIQIDVV